MNWDINATGGLFVAAGSLCWWLVRQAIFISRAHDTATAAKLQSDLVARGLDDLKQTVVRDYTSVAASSNLESRVLGAIAALGQQLERMTDRLELLFVPAANTRDHRKE